MGFLYWFMERFRGSLEMLFPARWRPDALAGRIQMRAEQAGMEAERAAQRARDQADPAALRRARRERWGARLRTALHVLIVIAIVLLLAYINYAFDLERVLRSPWPILHKVWLPLLFLLAYALFWLGWWLWLLLGPERETADFPDIEAAWKEGLSAMSQAGIEATEVPVFLVLGRSAGSVEDLFAAARLKLLVRHVPGGNDAPVHVYAGRQGIFVTCEGASLLGRQAELLTRAEEPPPEEAAEPGPAATQPVASPPPGGAQAAPTPGAQTEAAQAEGGVAVLTEERQAAQLLLTEGEPGEGRRRRHTLLKDTEEVERATARLKYLCRLIGRRRQPYCPINGILLVVPLAATDTDEDADQTGAVCRHDLTAVREAVQVHCPVLALVSDLENLPGFDDLVHYFPDAAQRERFLGRQFPLVPHLEPADVPSMLAGGIHWLCLTLFPTVVYKLYRLETPGREETEDVVGGNARLFQFLGQLRQRAPHLSRLLTRAVAGQPRGLLLFGGCYLAATGPDTAHGQAFVSGVFRQLVEYQNYVSWTADALDDEAGYRWLTRLGYLGIVVLFAALLTLVVLIWPH